MSRILQALKQLEARPATEAVPPSANPPAQPPAAKTPTMPFVPPPAPLERRPTEPLPPRQQKKHKAIRVAEKAARALQTAAEVDQLLTQLQPSVTECWTEQSRIESVQVAGFDPALLLDAYAVEAAVQLPEVVTVRETAREATAFYDLELNSTFIETRAPSRRDVIHALPSYISLQLAERTGIGSVQVQDQLPLVITIEDTGSLPASAPTLEAAAPIIELPLFAPTVVEQSLLPSDWLTPAIAVIDLAVPHQGSSAIVVTEHLPHVVMIRERYEVLQKASELASADVEPELAMLQALEDLRAMQRGIAPSVTEHWIPVNDDQALLVEHASGLMIDDACATSVVAADYAPQVITIREHVESDAFSPSRLVTQPLERESDLTFEQPGLSRSELTALLGTPQVSVMEAWLPTADEAALVVEQTAELIGDLDYATSVLASDYAPQVITVHEPREEEEAAPGLPTRMVTEPIRRETPAAPNAVEQIQAAVANLLGPAPVALADGWAADDVYLAATPVDVVTNVGDWPSSEAAASLMVEGFTSPEVTSPARDMQAAAPEVELHFQRDAPRRRALPAAQSVSKSRRQRHLPRVPDVRELQMRTLLRGPRGLSVTPLTAWEGALREELLRGSQAGAYRQLIERWRADQQAHQTSTMLVTSLGEAFAASDVIMHAAILLAETTDSTLLVVEADDEGAISRRLGLASKPGLGELLSPYDAHGETIFPSATPRLHILPRGRSLGILDPASPALRSLLSDLAHEYNWILLAGGRWDSPLMLPLARVAGGTYVVAPLADIKPTDATRAVNALRNGGARMLGSIIIDD